MISRNRKRPTPDPASGLDSEVRGIGRRTGDMGHGKWGDRVARTLVLSTVVLCFTLADVVSASASGTGSGHAQGQWTPTDTLQVHLDDVAIKRELPGPLTGAGCPESTLRQADQDRDRLLTAAEQAALSGLVEEAGRASIMGNPSRARELLQEAAALDPGNAEVLFRLGRLEAIAGDTQEAVALLCRSLHLDPDGSDSAAAWNILGELVPDLPSLPPPAADAAFTAGLGAWDAEAWDRAIQEFSRALVEHPEWAPAHFNRGLAYLRSGRIGAGIGDLDEYLSLEPDADDRQEIEALRVALAASVPAMEDEDPGGDALSPAQFSGPSAGTAFLSGLVVPGLGHVYSGRPGVGVLVLAGAGAVTAAGLFTRRVEVRCLALPVDGECPPGQEASRQTSRPYLFHGVAAAGAITFAGAVHAAFTARRRSGGGSIPHALTGDGTGIFPRSLGSLEFDGSGVGLELPDVVLPGQLPVRTRLRFEF